MGVGIRSMQKLLATIPAGLLAVAKVADHTKKLQAKTNETALNMAKKGYESAASIKAQNKKIEKSYVDLLNSTMPGVKDSKTKPEKVKQPEVIESSMKPAVNEKLLPKQEQKFILSEEGAEYPTIRADASATNINANDEDVGNLIEVRQKSLARSAAGREVAAKQDQLLSYYKKNVAKNPLATKSDMRRYLEEFGFGEDSSYYKNVGLDKHTLQRWQLESESGWGEDVALKFDSNIEGPLREHFKGNEAANDYLDTRLESVKFSIGYYNDANDLESNPDNSNFVEDINTIVKELKSGEYKELAKKYTGKDYDNVENKTEVEAASTPKYFVWDTEAASSEDDEDNEGIVF